MEPLKTLDDVRYEEARIPVDEDRRLVKKYPSLAALARAEDLPAVAFDI